jgi:hypothetical protein
MRDARRVPGGVGPPRTDAGSTMATSAYASTGGEELELLRGRAARRAGRTRAPGARRSRGGARGKVEPRGGIRAPASRRGRAAREAPVAGPGLPRARYVRRVRTLRTLHLWHRRAHDAE